MSFINTLLLKQKNDRFLDWLNTDIGDDTKNKDVIYELIGEITSLLNDDKIDNLNQFKNDLACYVYREST
tara:strand:+ start:2976 stop:3185 length:210 start_codon:yes stop_codon:yes gene_type:complete